MKFWDASAVVPLLSDEPPRAQLLELLNDDPQMLVWWGTTVEVVSALARREREGVLDPEAVADAVTALRLFSEYWEEVVPTEVVRRTAERLLRSHSLRAADSLQLAAALTAAEQDPSALEFVCFDERLAGAARREGFVVL